MALSFNNGVITDSDRNQTYDLNAYGQQAAKSRDDAGNLGALHSFYDAWNLKNQPQGSVTNPTGALLGGTQYNTGQMDKGLSNTLSSQAQGLMPQISEWYKSLRANQPNALMGTTAQAAGAPQQQQAVWSDQQPNRSTMRNQTPVSTDPRKQTFNALTGQSTPSAGGFTEAGGTPAAPGAPAAPAQTGVGAGRGYPSNWNANNAPGLASGGEGTTFATNPATGAAYETSPMYQWQLKQGEKAINRAAASRGRRNSSVTMNTLANFYNQLGANEADKQYNRTFDQQKLGLQAALAQAQAAGASSGQLASLYSALGNNMASGSQGYGAGIADLIARYGQQESQNQLGLGAQQGAIAQWRGTPIGNLLQQTGGENAQFWTALAQMGGDALNAYMKSRG